MGKSFQIALIALGVFSFSASPPAYSADPTKKKFKTIRIERNGKGEIVLHSLQTGDKSNPILIKDIVDIREDVQESEVVVETNDTITHFEHRHAYNEKLNPYLQWKDGELFQVKDENGQWVSPENMGIFDDDSHPINFGKHLGQTEWKKILAKKPKSLPQGCSESTWKKGYLEGLSGRRFAIEVGSDQFKSLSVNSKDPAIQKKARLAPNNPERRACKGLESEQLNCCVHGFMASVPELAKLIVKYKDHSQIKNDPELKRCFDDFGLGTQDGKTFCNAERSCPQYTLDEPIGYLGCYSLAFAFTTMHSSCKKQVSNGLKAQFADYPVVAAAVEQTKLQFGEAYAPNCTQVIKTASSAE
jgi:hypothetical protein